MGRLRRSRGAYVGAVAAGAMVLGFSLWPAASGAQANGSGHPRGGAVEWAGFAGNAQHTAVARQPAQPFSRIRWRTHLGLTPTYSRNNRWSVRLE